RGRHGRCAGPLAVRDRGHEPGRCGPERAEDRGRGKEPVGFAQAQQRPGPVLIAFNTRSDGEVFTENWYTERAVGVSLPGTSQSLVRECSRLLRFSFSP